MEAEVGAGRRRQTPTQAEVQDEDDEEPIVLDDMFRKTEAKPSLYWLPLSEEEVRGVGAGLRKAGGDIVFREIELLSWSVRGGKGSKVILLMRFCFAGCSLFLCYLNSCAHQTRAHAGFARELVAMCPLLTFLPAWSR